METQNIIKQVLDLPGNLIRGKKTYISQANMYRFAKMIGNADANRGFLVVPYMVSKSGSLYELIDCQFDVSIKGDSSYYVEHLTGNVIGSEITRSIKPQAIVAAGDNSFCEKAVGEYLDGMQKLKFEDEKKVFPEFNEAELVYQIFTE